MLNHRSTTKADLLNQVLKKSSTTNSPLQISNLLWGLHHRLKVPPCLECSNMKNNRKGSTIMASAYFFFLPLLAQTFMILLAPHPTITGKGYIGSTQTWNKITLESCCHIAEQQFIVSLPWIVLGLYFTQRSLTYQCPDLGICATLLKLMWSAHTKQTIAKEHKQPSWCHGTH